MDARAIPPPRVYTQKEIARIYKIPKSTMYDEIREGTFPEKLPGWGRAARWDVGEVESWYARRSGRQPWATNSRPLVTNLPDLIHEVLAMSRGNETEARRDIERFEPE